MKKNNFLILGLAMLTVLVSGCSFQTKRRGYIFPENLEQEVAGIKTVKQLEDKIGSPQTKTEYGDEVWIYYGADENNHGPFPLSYDNKTVLLVWVKGSRVIKTQILNDEDLKEVVINQNETQIPAAIELNAIQELLNNINRFTPAGLGQ